MAIEMFQVVDPKCLTIINKLSAYLEGSPLIYKVYNLQLNGV